MAPTPDAPITVLVPDDLGLTALAEVPGVTAVRYRPGQPWPQDHRDAAVVVVGIEESDAVGAALGELTGLRLIQTLHAGYEPWVPVRPEGVLLSNGRGAHGGSSAEWVVAALLSIYRELRLFADQQTAGTWRPRTTETLIDKRVLVLGAGDLARNLAARLTPFEATVTLVGRHARDGVRGFDDIDELLPDADVVVSMLPDDPSTRHLIDAAFLAKCRDATVVVNVGRGGAVDPEALLAELTSGRLRAALDVTEPEPLPAGHPLWSAPNLLLTPHVGGNTAGAMERAWRVAAEQIAAFATGGQPPNVVAGQPANVVAGQPPSVVTGGA